MKDEKQKNRGVFGIQCHHIARSPNVGMGQIFWAKKDDVKSRKGQSGCDLLSTEDLNFTVTSNNPGEPHPQLSCWEISPGKQFAMEYRPFIIDLPMIYLREMVMFQLFFVQDGPPQLCERWFINHYNPHEN
jgi:hypothetical protein